MAGVEDEDEYKPAAAASVGGLGILLHAGRATPASSGAADSPPSSPSPTSKPKLAAAATGGGLGWRRKASRVKVMMRKFPHSMWFTDEDPEEGAAPARRGRGGQEEDCAAVVEDQSNNAAVEQCAGDETRAVKDDSACEVNEKVTEQEGAARTLHTAEDGIAVGLQEEEEDVVVAEQGEDVISVQDQLEVVELCSGDQLRTTTEDNSGQDQDLVEQQEETEYYTALEAVEECTNDGSEAVKDDNIVEEEERAVELKGALDVLDAAKDGAPVKSQEEDVAIAEQEEDGALEAVEQCTSDASKAVKDGNIVEEKRAVELEGALDVLDAAKDGAPVKSQEEDVAIAEQEGDEDVISVQDQHKVVDQCSGDQLITAADDNAAQGQDVVKHEGATEYYIAVEAVEQCINYGPRAVKDGNLVEEKDKVMEQVVSVGVLYAAKGCATGESQEDGDVVVAEQIEDGISVQDQHKVVELFTCDQLEATADDNAAQDQEVLEQEGATVTLGAVEECTIGESRVAKDGKVVEEMERLVKPEGVVGVLNASKDNIIVESQEEEDGSGVESQENEDVVAAEDGGDVISVRDEANVMEQCTSDQQRRTTDDNAAEDQELVDQCTCDQLRASTNGYAGADQEARRENIGFSAGYPQRPGKLDCLFYLLKGCCSNGSSCDFNHPQFSGDQLVTTTDDSTAQGQDVVKHEKDRPVKQENMEQRLQNIFAYKEKILENLLDGEPPTEDGRYVTDGRFRMQLLNISANFPVKAINIYDWHRGQNVYYHSNHELVGLNNLVLTGPQRPIGVYGSVDVHVFPLDKSDSGPMRELWDFPDSDDYEEPSMWVHTVASFDREVDVTYLLIPYTVEVEVCLGLISIAQLNGYCGDGLIFGTVKAWTDDYEEHHVSLFTREGTRPMTHKLSCDEWVSLPLAPSEICLPNRRNLQLTIEVDLVLQYGANKCEVVSNLMFRGSETQSVMVNDNLLSVGVTMEPDPQASDC